MTSGRSSGESQLYQNVQIWPAELATMFYLSCLNLVKRGMNVDSVCPICGLSDEIIIHALLLCEESKDNLVCLDNF